MVLHNLITGVHTLSRTRYVRYNWHKNRVPTRIDDSTGLARHYPAQFSGTIWKSATLVKAKVVWVTVNITVELQHQSVQCHSGGRDVNNMGLNTVLLWCFWMHSNTALIVYRVSLITVLNIDLPRIKTAKRATLLWMLALIQVAVRAWLVGL